MLIGLLVVAVIAALVVGWRLQHRGPAPLTSADVEKAVTAGLQKAQQQQRNTPSDAATAYRRIAPSLVTVVSGPAGGSKGKTGSAQRTDSASGAGVVINEQGAVLTALHVVSGDEPITVRFADGTQSTAQVRTAEAATDIAVLTVAKLPQIVVPAVMGGGVQVGDTVFPVGNPLGLDRSLSAGVVSGLDRQIAVKGGRVFKRLIQFDAAVNPGNSGGPLLDRDGHVVGVVTGLVNPSGQPFFVGLGFAVPIATAGGAAGGPSK